MSTTKIPDELLSSGVGTGASKLLKLDSSGKLPAVDGSALTGVAPTKATIDALGIAASSITGALPAIDGSNLTGIDLASIRNDISTLALHSAVADNRAAYNLPNSFIDQFEDDTGIGTETDTDRDTSEYVSSVVTTFGAVPRTTGTAIGSMTEGGGIAAAFDGNTSQGSGAGARKIAGGSWGHYVGKDYGSGNSYAVTQMKVTNVTSEGLLNEGASNAEHRMRLEYSDNGSSWSVAWESVDSFTRQANVALGATVTITSSTGGTNNISTAGSHRYWRYNCKGNTGNGANVAELEFWADIAVVGATGTLISTAQTSNAAQTKVSGVVLYKNNAGTATLGTDLKIYFTCNGGTNWTESTPVAAGTFSSGILMAKCPEVTCTSGTDVRYKAVWANQASGTKETQLHGIGMNY